MDNLAAFIGITSLISSAILVLLIVVEVVKCAMSKD